ncbi:MAG: sigma-70 family RNA polymerase sigma factor [Mycolicibacterium sp.]|nr:sigma-70 family RNA polymerase sigma factor [Mycolicibacterium sp.]
MPKLAEPAAFPGWLRGIVQHQAYRVLRRRHLEAAPLDEAAEVASDAPTPDRRLEQHREAAAALTVIAGLPALLREPAALFYVHECSHQDIAAFLGIPATTVNNRLHRARSLLQQRIPTMTESTLRSHALPDDFANRIGRLATARSGLVEVMFDQTARPVERTLDQRRGEQVHRQRPGRPAQRRRHRARHRDDGGRRRAARPPPY